MFLNLKCLIVCDHFLVNCAQLLHPRPNFLTAFLGEEVKHLWVADFYRHLWFNKAKNSNRKLGNGHNSWAELTRNPPLISTLFMDLITEYFTRCKNQLICFRREDLSNESLPNIGPNEWETKMSTWKREEVFQLGKTFSFFLSFFFLCSFFVLSFFFLS